MDVDTFKLRLATLTYLNKTDVLAYQQRAAMSSNLDNLLREAISVNNARRNKVIIKKTQDFLKNIEDLGLSRRDQSSLTKRIVDTTDLKKLRLRAEKLKKARMRKISSGRQKKLYRFLSGLNIDQSNMNAIISRFKKGENETVLRKNALSLQQKKAGTKVSRERQFLKNALTRTGISQVNQNRLMSQFTPNMNRIRALIDEAKKLKQSKNTQNIELSKLELTKLANTFGVNFSKEIASLNSKNKAEVLKKNIERAGESRRTMSLAQLKEELIRAAKELGVYQQFSSAIINAKTKRELDVVRINVRTAAKNVLFKNADDIPNFSNRIKRTTDFNQLISLKNNIRQVALNKDSAKKQKNIAKLNRNKQDFIAYVQSTTLPPNRKQVFINRMKLNKVDIPKLTQNVETLMKNLNKTQRVKNLDEFEAYIVNLNINKNAYTSKFRNTNISLDQIKKEVNNVVKENAEKKALKEKARKISLNLNVSNLNAARIRYEAEYKKKLKDEKKKLSKLALTANMNGLAEISSIKNLDAIKPMKNRILEGARVSFGNVSTIENIKRAKRVIKNETYAKARANKANKERQVDVKRRSLRMFLNEYKNLTNTEKITFLKKFENGVDIPQIQQNANMYVKEKKLVKQQNAIQKLTAHLTRIGLDPKEQVQFIDRLVTSDEPLNTVKKDADAYFLNVVKKGRDDAKNKLSEGLKKLNLNKSNYDYLMNKYEKTYLPTKDILKEAKTIEGFRKHERWVESEEEFIDYLNTLEIDPKNRRNITSKLNGFYVNFSPLKKAATNLAIKHVNAPRAKNRKDLENYVNKSGLSARVKSMFLRNFNTGVENIKKNVNAFKTEKNNANKTKRDEEFKKYLNTLKFLTNKNKTVVFNRNQANNLNVRRMKEGQFAMEKYLVNNMGLNLTNERVQRIIKNYGEFPYNMNRYTTRAQELKMLSDEKNRLRQRIKGLPNTVPFIQRISNIKNVENVQKIDEKINQAYISILKNELSNMVLNSGMNTEINLKSVSTIEEAEQLRQYIMNMVNAGKKIRDTQLREAIKNLSANNQAIILQSNLPHNTKMKKVSLLKNKQKDKNFINLRNKLYTYMNTELNLNVTDRNAILKEFNTTGNLNTMRAKAKQLKNTRDLEKIASNRKKVEKIIEPLDLTNANKKSILQNFNANPGKVLSFETKAKELKKKRLNEKRGNERNELVQYLSSLKLSNGNVKSILDAFDSNPEQKLSKSKIDASNIRVQRNREKLTGVMNNLVLKNSNRKQLLINFKNKPSAVNALISRAKQINSKTRGETKIQKELRNYIASLKLGDRGAKLLKKVNSSLTPQIAAAIKSRADKARAEADAVIARKKRGEIKKYVNSTNLNQSVKNSFTTSVRLNTNVNALKRKIQETVKNIKSAKSKPAKLKTELKVFLDTLNLNDTEKKSLLNGVTGSTKSIKPFKSRAMKIVKGKKTAEITQGIRESQKKKRDKTMKVREQSRKINTVKLQRGIYHIKKVIPTLPLNSKLKDTFMRRVNQSRGNLNRIKYDIGVIISKKSIPLKNKQTLINKLTPK